MKRTILILTIGFGAGHRQAASTLARSCEKELPEFRTEVVDVTPILPRWFRLIYVDLYLFILRVAPRLWEKFERHQRRQTQTAPVWLWRSIARRLYRRLAPREIAAILSTEVGVNEIAALLKKEYWPAVPVVAVLTDYDVDRAWVQDEVDAFCVGSQEVREELISMKVPRDKIVVTGIPIDERFAESGETRPEKGSSRPRILLAGGGQGLGQMEKLVDALDQLLEVGALTVLVGHNHTLHRKLLSAPPPARLHVQVLTWTEEMPKMLRAHDVLISKPGGITITEAMASGLPVLACFPLPGSEVKHGNLIERWQVGLAARTMEEFKEKAGRILSDGLLRQQCSENARQLYRKQHQHTVIEVIQKHLG